jgi:hypothetical protein
VGILAQSCLSQNVKSKFGHKEEHKNKCIPAHKVRILFKYFVMHNEARNSFWYAEYSGKSPVLNATFSEGRR